MTEYLYHIGIGLSIKADSEEEAEDVSTDEVLKAVEDMLKDTNISVTDAYEKLAFAFNLSSEDGNTAKVVFDGDKTVVKFADGSYEIVHYNPDYGYPYDAEKAIIAGMLKHLVGGVYTRPLKANAEKIREMNQRNQKRCECKNDCECKNNISDEMICRDNMCKTDSLTDKVFRDPEGNVLNNMSEDDKFLYMLNSMEDDIFES